MAVFSKGSSRVGPWIATDAVKSGSGTVSLTADQVHRLKEGVSA